MPEETTTPETGVQTDTPNDVPATEAPKAPENITTPNMRLGNKYAIGDKLWVIFTNGPLLKINQFTVKSFVAEVIGLDPISYVYGYTIAGDGHEDAVNMTFVREDMCFFDKQMAVDKAGTMVEDVVEQYEKQIQKVTSEYEVAMKNLNSQKAMINADNLDVKPREVVVPPQTPQEAVAENTTARLRTDEELANDTETFEEAMDERSDAMPDESVSTGEELPDPAEDVQIDTVTDPDPFETSPENPNPQEDVKTNPATDNQEG